MTDELGALRAAIEGLYAAFRHYPLRPVTDYCTHCVTPEDEARIHAKPLRELDGKDLGKFGGEVLYTWGDERDFKHFLPRLLDLAAFDAGYWPDLDALFRKLDYGKWRTWPESERRAIESFLRAYLSAAVEDPFAPPVSPEVKRALDNLAPGTPVA
ncbi:MAG: hypothetical protein ACRDJE_00310 [Dehalococcoidia bacterium]